MTVSMIRHFRTAIGQFMEDECGTLAASLSFYTLFAMPPLLFLLVAIVSSGMAVFFPQEQAQAEARQFLEQQAAQLIGSDAAGKEVGAIIERNQRQSGRWWKNALSLLGVLVGATGLMAALQAALNRVWGVKPKEGKAAKRFLIKRLMSLAMILGFGFLMLVSFLLSTILSLLGGYLTERLGLDGTLTVVINETVSFFTAWIVFSGLLRFMPDAVVLWRHAAFGGFLTVCLFTCGRLVLFYYLAATNPAERLGSASGALIVIILWIYYSSMILLFGAEFTASLHEGATEPEAGAVAVEQRVTSDGDALQQ